MKAARAVWCSFGVLVILWAWLAFDGTPNWDGEEALLYVMLAVSFPASLLAIAFLAGLYAVLEAIRGVALQTSRIEMLFSWSVFAILGYVQWFVLFSRLLNRWRRRTALSLKDAP